METKIKTNKLKKSISFKLFIITALSLVLLIPSAMIKRLVNERAIRKTETENEVAQKWGAEQLISGPILEIPFTYESGKEDVNTYKKYVYVTPEDLQITGKIIPEVRKRGIFKVITYKSKLNINGVFNSVPEISLPGNNQKFLWDDIKLITGVSDLRGINNKILVNWNSKPVSISPGVSHCQSIKSGFYAKINQYNMNNNSFNYSIDLNGSKRLLFFPIAKNNTVNIESEWPHPSFTGNFLPDTHTIDDNGFNAHWNILEMNRSIENAWVGPKLNKLSDYNAFGVELLEPVDNYQKTERSVKYAILFIGLTFLVIFFREIITGAQIHPIQYLIIGSALVIFYSVLIALSEHIGFNLAYLFSSVIIVSMITLFATSIFRQKSGSIVLMLILILTYAFIFMTLQIADYALIVGNIGILVILGLIMYFSKKIDWYKADKKELLN